MIPQGTCQRLFYYEYRPLTKETKRAEVDAGFSVVIYENNTVTFTLNALKRWEDIYADVVPYYAERIVCKKVEYALDKGFAARFREHLALWDCLLEDVDLNICFKDGRVPQYLSILGFGGRNMIVCDELNTLIGGTIVNNKAGRMARRLILVLEDVATMIAEHGLNLGVNVFYPNADVVPISVWPLADSDGVPDMSGIVNM